MKMASHTTFSAYVKSLRMASKQLCISAAATPGIESMLDGEARRVTHETVPFALQKQLGAFFTGSALRELAWSKFRTPLGDGAVVLDPAVGAGDLLIPATSKCATKSAGITLLGFDIYEPFVAAARARLAIAEVVARASGHKGEFRTKLRTASGLVQRDAVRRATHIVMNPPFLPVTAPLECSWGSGRVNQAALFIDFACTHASPGTEIVAIVPDVLRSGANYANWRKHTVSLAHIEGIEPAGQFDSWTDVDVAVLHLRRRRVPLNGELGDWGSLATAATGRAVRDRFRISVGSVVDYRTPRLGRWQPYLTARNAPAWSVLKEVPQHRRFAGRLAVAPFVAVRRTSSPSDPYRAVATIVNSAEPVAVENHLLVAEPYDGSLAACRALLAHLRSPAANSWLNEVTSCRHLTVGALGLVPWEAR